MIIFLHCAIIRAKKRGETMKITKWERLILYPLAVGLLILFAFYDLPIMETLFNPRNVFGRMGELGGEIPTQLLGVVCGFWLFRFRDTSSKSRSLWWGILFFVIAIFFAGYGGGQVYSYLKDKPWSTYTFHPGIWFAVPIAIVYLGVGALIAFKTKISNPKEAIVFAWFVLILYFSTLLLMNVLKFFWARPRWRYLVSAYGSSAAEYFQPWYVWGFRWQLDDRFASFPSGHTMNALCWIALAGASAFMDKLKGKEWIIRLLAYVWAALVALSRTIMGAHFSSDTTAGFLVELLLFDLLGTFFFPWFHSKVLGKQGDSQKPLKSASN
jgi:membrane-associated phospholipid phosphatase